MESAFEGLVTLTRELSLIIGKIKKRMLLEVALFGRELPRCHGDKCFKVKLDRRRDQGNLLNGLVSLNKLMKPMGLPWQYILQAIESTMVQ